MAEPRILVVDDETSMCQYLTILLRKEGYEVTTASSGVEALALMERRPFDVVISDIQMPQLDGIQLLKGIKAIDPDTPVIMLTAYASEQSAIDAVNLGAYAYLQKHSKNDEIRVAVRNALQLRTAKCENRQLRKQLRRHAPAPRLIGQSPVMQSIYRMIDKIAATPATVLITGESGTGKELIAKTIHARSGRADKPYVAINCGAIPETLLESQLFGHVKGAFTGAFQTRKGRFEAAEGGDIFLDEIGDLPLSTQVKLLRVLEEKVIERVGDNRPIHINVRIISATNRDLPRLVREGAFREDLFYRINVIPIHVPPLRERTGDIPLLAESFFRKLQLKSNKHIQGISNRAMALLMHYPWPGNVRELKSAFEYAFVTCRQEAIEPHDLPPVILQSDPAPVAEPPPQKPRNRDEMKKMELIAALEQAGGNQSRAAELLGVSRVTVWNRMKRYGLKPARTIRA